MTTSACLTAVGTFIFAMSESFLMAATGLLLVGGAVAMAIVITLELAGRWFPLRRFALTSGLIMVIGVMVGPAIIQPITGWMLDRIWTGAMESGIRTYDILFIATSRRARAGLNPEP